LSNTFVAYPIVLEEIDHSKCVVESQWTTFIEDGFNWMDLEPFPRPVVGDFGVCLRPSRASNQEEGTHRVIHENDPKDSVDAIGDDFNDPDS
jgi:hypothetical protein